MLHEAVLGIKPWNQTNLKSDKDGCMAAVTVAVAVAVAVTVAVAAAKAVAVAAASGKDSQHSVLEGSYRGLAQTPWFLHMRIYYIYIIYFYMLAS